MIAWHAVVFLKRPQNKIILSDYQFVRWKDEKEMFPGTCSWGSWQGSVLLKRQNDKKKKKKKLPAKYMPKPLWGSRCCRTCNGHSFPVLAFNSNVRMIIISVFGEVIFSSTRYSCRMKNEWSATNPGTEMIVLNFWGNSHIACHTFLQLGLWSLHEAVLMRQKSSVSSCCSMFCIFICHRNIDMSLGRASLIFYPASLIIYCISRTAKW